MTRLSLGLAVCVLLVGPSWAATTIEFGPGTGGWSCDGAGNLTFDQTYLVLKGLGSPSDALVGAYAHIPDFAVGGIPGGPYILTPATGNAITITDNAGVLTYLTGTLGNGYLDPAGTTGVGYVRFQPDITGITVNNTIGSAALTALADMPVPQLDFELSLNGAGINFKTMLDTGQSGYDGFSGAMTVVPVPAPGAILLVAMGTALVGWLRRRRTVSAGRVWP